MDPPSVRLALIDALRGIAAIGVVLYHVYLQYLLPGAQVPLPEPVHTVLANGYLGVYIFFVLSGFVIAHSVRDAVITGGFIGRFVLRRSLRLDPPYWAAIAAAIVLPMLGAPTEAVSPSSLGDTLAHVLYVQQFLGIPHLVGVFWTLCLEIQFYLVYVVAMAMVQRLAGRPSWLVFGPLWVVSLVVAARVVHVRSAVFLWAWPYFFLGAITAWHHEGRLSGRAWMLVTAATSAPLLASYSRWITADDALQRTAVAVATSLILFLADRARRDGRSLFHTFTLGGPLQYLGRISYSLYLTHVLVALSAARLGIRLLGDRPLVPIEVGALLLGCTLACVAVAHVLHLVVERPAQRISRHVRLEQRSDPTVSE